MDLMPWHPTPTPPSCSPLEHSADDMVLSTEVSEANPASTMARRSAEATSTGRGETTPTPNTAVIMTPGEVNSSGYETALHVLLSLSSDQLSSSVDQPQAIELSGFVDEGTRTDGEHAEQPASAPILPDLTSQVTMVSPRQGCDHRNHYNDRHLNQRFDVPHVAQLHPIQRGTPRALDTLTAMEASSNDAVNQIRHYRYNLATWLDICNASQFFGTIVSVMSLRSKPIRNAILVLSMASLAAPKGDVLAEHITVALMQGTGMLLNHAENVPSPATALRGDSSTSSVKDTTDGNMVYTVHKMLLLCGRILDFRAGVRRQVGVSRMQQWHQLAEAANHWYAKRPMAFQPLVDLDLPSSVFVIADAASTEDADEDAIRRPKGAPTDDDELHPLFPSILFTNGTAVLGNQLYHTAMMLLLQSKPRTAIHEQSGVGGGGLNGGSRPSPAWSPLWHAQRVCGIALSNIRRECWDLPLVASLWVVAQTMTYEPQQRALLRGFDALATRMGWQVDHFQVTLRQVWGMEG
ncbi:hypothetical protein SEUCBS140593_002738 [Sporothrix eucalyptigena]|uniref:C6 zinc finger domain containing protein n=1 Tax=Sporothrix eucalyptigena TaxID=1812306 RepID=A0ABP0B959_9PEZI